VRTPENVVFQEHAAHEQAGWRHSCFILWTHRGRPAPCRPAFFLPAAGPLEETSTTDLHKRSLIKVAALSAVAAAALAGCGKKEEAAPAPAPVAEAPAAAATEPLKIAFAYVGPVGDGGYTFAHDQGRLALEKEFGDKIKTSYVESVPESADAERVLRDMAANGNKLVFGTTFGYMEPIQKIAPDFPDVKFEHATG